MSVQENLTRKVSLSRPKTHRSFLNLLLCGYPHNSNYAEPAIMPSMAVKGGSEEGNGLRGSA
jgi:hypothetical protein